MADDNCSECGYSRLKRGKLLLPVVTNCSRRQGTNSLMASVQLPSEPRACYFGHCPSPLWSCGCLCLIFSPLQPPPFPYKGFIGRMMPLYTSTWSFSTWTTGEPFVTGSRLQAWLPQLPLYRCQAGAWGLYQQHLTHQCTTAERSTQNREELPPN